MITIFSLICKYVNTPGNEYDPGSLGLRRFSGDILTLTKLNMIKIPTIFKTYVFVSKALIMLRE